MLTFIYIQQLLTKHLLFSLNVFIIVISLIKTTRTMNNYKQLNTDQKVFSYHNMTEAQFYHSCEGLRESEIAQRFLELATNVINGGWYVDVSYQNGKHYQPCFNGSSADFKYVSVVSRGVVAFFTDARIGLKDKERAIFCGKTFTHWYREVVVKRHY